MSLTLDTLREICKRSIHEAGPRYTEETHVDLEISEHFSAMCRDQFFVDSLHRARGELSRSFSRVYRASFFDYDKSLADLLTQLEQSVTKVLELLRTLPVKYDQVVDEFELERSTEELATLMSEFDSKLYHYNPPKKEQTKEYNQRDEKDEYRHDFWKFSSSVDAVHRLIRGPGFKLFVKPSLWIRGVAGSGKTHLFCDTAKKRLDSSAPALLLLGQQLSTDDIWKQLCQKLGLSLGSDPKLEFITATATLCAQHSSKLLILIDAVNEGLGLRLWPDVLEPFRLAIAQAPHLALSVSCRSTYESAIVASDSWVKIRHIGFERNIYQATKRYFQHYQIKSHEIPLIGEFGNPLFLKTYCEALEGYNLTSPSRGHKGIKSIHEKYFHKIDSKIGSRLSYPKSIKPCHELAHIVASDMASRGQEWIPIEHFVNYAKKIQTKYRINGDLAGEILSEGLFSRDFFYDSETKSQCEAVRFGFQKFSDIFVARELLLQNDLTKENIGEVFLKRDPIRKLLESPYQNQNLIEALSVLIPEWTKGKHELINLAEGATSYDALAEAYIDSLAWRETSAFPEERKAIVDIFRKISGHNQIYYQKTLTALLTVSTTPDHPINAQFLDAHLMQKKMPIRDASWLPFLHDNFDEDGVISRIIDWPRNIDLSLTTNDSLFLLALTTSWFLVSSNRYIRDRSTKSLVSIFVVRPEFALKLLRHFSTVDDPYLLERLSTAIYGMVARSANTKHLEELCKFIYEEFFLKNKVPANIVIRYYWKSIIEATLSKGASLEIDLSKITPPFKTTWPRRIPTEATLEKKYSGIHSDRNDFRRGVTSIYSSVMSFGDFARYVIGTNSQQSPWRHKNFVPIDARIKLLRGTLTKRGQKSWYDLLIKFYKSPVLRDSDFRSKLDKVLKSAEKDFVKTLTPKQQKSLRSIKSDLRLPRKRQGDFLELSVIQRMVMQRVFTLGYDPKLHGEFDIRLDRGDYHRKADKPERIGKKYQWMAYFDVLGLVSDHFDHADRYSGEVTEVSRLDDMSYVDQIDPTISARSEEELPKEDLRLGITFFKHDNWKEDLADAQWVRDQSDLSSPSSLIERSDSQGNNWLLLGGGYIFKQEAPPDKDRSEHPIREIFYLFNAYVYRKSDERKVRNFLESTNFIGRRMPETRDQISPHFGEFYTPCHRPDAIEEGLWRTSSRSIPFKFMMTTDQYLYERGTFDCSLDEGMNIYMPAFHLASEMRLNFGRFEGSYFDSSSDLAAFNLSSKGAPFGLMFSKEKLLKFLAERKLGIFWTQISEKQMLGGYHGRENWLGRLDYSTSLILDGDQLVEIGRKINFNDPRAEGS